MEFKKYNEFLIVETKKNGFYKFVLSEIQINIEPIIKELKEQFHISSWYSYNNANSLTLNYFQTSNVDDENLYKARIFLFEKLPYLKDFKCQKDDHRLVISFLEIGDPVKFKFIRPLIK